MFPYSRLMLPRSVLVLPHSRPKLPQPFLVRLLPLFLPSRPRLNRLQTFFEHLKAPVLRLLLRLHQAHRFDKVGYGPCVHLHAVR